MTGNESVLIFSHDNLLFNRWSLPYESRHVGIASSTIRILTPSCLSPLPRGISSHSALCTGCSLTLKAGNEMKAISELRNGERLYFETPVLVEDTRTGYRYDGTMFNHSKGGMYLESDYAPRPNRKIRININKFSGSSSPRSYLAEVRWRQPLGTATSSYSYGIGVKYF